MNTKLTKNSLSNLLLKFGGYCSVMLVLYCFTEVVFADDLLGSDRLTLGKLALNIVNSMGDVARLITAVSYVAGVSFALMGMLKFKAHKDNPAQVPLSQPLVLLAISAGLVYLPSLISTGGQTLWKDSQISASTSGTGLGGLID